MTRRILRSVVTALVGVAATACSPRPPAGASASDSASRVETDSARIARLELEARALARTDGCASAEQCRVAPVGHRACGGPRTYLPYCALTTDSAALFAKLGELARAEEEWQRKSGAVSTCEMRLPPAPTVSGGRCTAAPAGGGAR